MKIFFSIIVIFLFTATSLRADDVTKWLGNEIDGILDFLAFAIDNVIFAICIIEIIPSSKRVPELEIIETIGSFFDTAKSMAKEIFSPEIILNSRP